MLVLATYLGTGAMRLHTLVVLAALVALLPPAPALAGQRIDEDLLETLDEHTGPIPVFALLSQQSELDETSHRTRPDLSKEEWRQHAVAELQALSSSTQSELLAALEAGGHAAEVERAFWIVNGLSLSVDAAAIRWLAASEHVARVYRRCEKPADLISTEGRFTQAFEQPVDVVTLDEVLAHRDLSWNLTRIQADLVWSRLGLIGRGVVIAILDSGVNYRHSDFRYHLWRNEGEVERNNLDDDGNGYVDDIYGFNFANGNSNVADDFFHGTSSASIMVGDGRGGMLTGVAPGAELMVLRMYDQMTRHNNSSLWRAYQYDAWEALQYAVAEGAHVVNMSFAWEPAENPLHAVWRYASTNVVAAGVVMVAGAGNFRGSYPIPGQIRPPASVPAVIATGGTFEDDSVADLTSRGPVTWSMYPPFDDYPLPEGLPQVAFSAPWGYFPVIVFSGRGYQVLAEQRGSSLTSPHVAGVVALMLEDNPELMPEEVRERLARSSLDVGAMGTDPYTGSGIVQAYDAIMLGSVALPRVVAVRYRPTSGSDDASTATPLANGGAPPASSLRAGDAVWIEIDIENPGATDDGATFTLESPSGDVRVTEPTLVVSHLARRHTLRFRAKLSSSARPGSVAGLRLSTRLDHGGLRATELELPVWGSDTLLVDDDGGGPYEAEWRRSLERQGKPYDLLSAWPTLQTPLPELGSYSVVVWIKGEEAYGTLSPSQKNALDGYLAGGGRLVLVGQNAARDLQDDGILSRLGSRFVSDIARPRSLRGAAGSFLDGFEAPFLPGGTLPDLVAATATGRLLLPVEATADSAESDPAGVAVGADGSVILTIEIAGIADVTLRDELVRRLIEGSAPTTDAEAVSRPIGDHRKPVNVVHHR